MLFYVILLQVAVSLISLATYLTRQVGSCYSFWILILAVLSYQLYHPNTKPTQDLGGWITSRWKWVLAAFDEWFDPQLHQLQELQKGNLSFPQETQDHPSIHPSTPPSRLQYHDKRSAALATIQVPTKPFFFWPMTVRSHWSGTSRAIGASLLSFPF